MNKYVYTQKYIRIHTYKYIRTYKCIYLHYIHISTCTLLYTYITYLNLLYIHTHTRIPITSAIYTKKYYSYLQHKCKHPRVYSYTHVQFKRRYTHTLLHTYTYETTYSVLFVFVVVFINLVFIEICTCLKLSRNVNLDHRLCCQKRNKYKWRKTLKIREKLWRVWTNIGSRCSDCDRDCSSRAGADKRGGGGALYPSCPKETAAISIPAPQSNICSLSLLFFYYIILLTIIS